MQRCLLALLIFIPGLVSATELDTLQVKKGELLILDDTIFAPKSDTQIVINNRPYKLKGNPYRNSENFYSKMKEVTGQNKVTSRLFDLLYVEKGSTNEYKDDPDSRSSIEPFIPFENLRIGKISIKHVDILQGDVNDTSRRATAYYARMANRIHFKTWNSIIRHTLTVRSGDPINPYSIADSERLLRRLQFIQDARIYIQRSSDDEEANLVVAVQDRFAWGVNLDVNRVNRFEGQLTNRNIAGIGKYASVSYLYDGRTEASPHGYSIQAGGQQIQKLIANWRINHTKIHERSEWGLNLDKPFLTPDTKYGGGIDLRKVKDSTLTFDGDLEDVGFYDLNYQDFWIGRSFALPSKYQRQNITLTTRWLRHSFIDRPYVDADSNSFYYDRNLFISELSISSQKFLKSNYITSFGISEDIPTGYRFSIIGGKDFNEFYQQNYVGFQIYWSTYLVNWGYLFLNQEVGTFDHETDKRGVYRTQINYFSPLIEVNKYFLRNFLKINIIKGIDQPISSSINLEDRIRDIQGATFGGNGLISLSVEQVTYTPWYLYGFRFAPFFYYNVGEVWDYRGDLTYSHGYQGVGGGIRIRNESLAFSTLELRLTHFITGQELEKKTLVSLKSTVPISFNSIFRFKPSIAPFR